MLGALSASLLPLTAAKAATPATLFEQVGTLERFPADARAALGSELVPPFDKTDFVQKGRAGTLIAIPEVRQLWQFFFSANDATKAGAVVRDLDSLQIIRSLELPGGLDRSTVHSYGGEWAHAIDLRGKRLFLMDQRLREVVEIDLTRYTIVRRPILASIPPPPNLAGAVSLVLMPGGITYDPVTDDLLLLYGGPQSNSAADTNTFLYPLDVSKPPTAADPSLLHQLQSCSGPMSSVDVGGITYGWEILTTEEFLFVPCHRAGNAGAVVRMARPSPTNRRPREDVVVGPVYVETVLVDQVSKRMFMATIEREIWVFETETMSFVGIVATGPERTQDVTSYGLDRKTGRLFFQSQTFGLGVAEGRFFPIPQGRTMPRKTAGHERIFSDGDTNRVFVLEGLDDARVAAYRIYRTGPAPIPPPPPDPDRNTADVDERDGLTEPRYFASGSGYGVRVLLAKGVATVAPAPTAGLVAPTAQAIDKYVSSRCGYTDRELVAGRVRKTEYDTGSTAAAAIAFDVDGATKQDLDKPSRCDFTVRDPLSNTERFRGIFATAPTLDGPTQAPSDNPNTPDDEARPRWTLDQAECTSSDEATKQRRSATKQDFGPSTVDCPAPGGTLTAKATAGEMSGGVAVSRAWTETRVERTAAGVKSTVTAVAQGVDIAGVIRFAEIRSTATSLSNGRPPSKDMSTHRVAVRGAEVNGIPVCDNCLNLASLVDTLNAAAAGKAIFRTAEGVNSGLDESLKRGSRRGALTAVQKSAARQASDRALVGDFTAEVPGLEMTVFNDNTQWGRARQVYQFAGVSSAATYNIVLRPADVPFDDDPGSGDESPIDGLGGDAPFADIAAALDGTTDLGGVLPVLDDGGSGSRGEGRNDDGNGGRGLFGSLRALARGIRLFLTNPRHSLLLLTAWALFSLPGVLSRRRRLLTDMQSG